MSEESILALMVEALEAVLLAPDNHPDKPAELHKLGVWWLRRYIRLGNIPDMENAIACLEQVVELVPDGHPLKPSGLNNLGSLWISRFKRLSDLADIDKAIECASRAVELTPDGYPEKTGCLTNLGVSWQSRFEEFGDPADIDKAIECTSRAVELTPDGHPHKSRCLNSLGDSWDSRFEQLGDLTDLDKAIECKLQAVELTLDSHPDKPTWLNNLGDLWQRRFERFGNLIDIDKAIECQSQAVELTLGIHPDKPTWLNNLGSSWQMRFERLGNLSDLDKAIECLSQAVELTPDGHPDKPGSLSNLGASWRSRFEQLGDLADIDKAIECASQAVELVPDGHPDKLDCMHNLGISWQRRFEQLGNLSDIDKAVKYLSQAVELTPDGHPDKLACLNNLGLAWQIQFDQLGDLTTIDKAIECALQAVELTPDGHPDKPSCLSNLGHSWQTRFRQLGNLIDIDKAIECQSQAVELTPDDHPLKSACMINLGISWQMGFGQLGNLTDLDKAIECLSQAVELTPDGHPDKPGSLSNLGASWRSRFEQLGDLADIDKAIECASQAVGLITAGHPDKPTCLNNLGVSWQIRFRQLGDLANLDKAIEYLSQAVELTPDGDPDKPGRLIDLGNSWKLQFERHGRTEDLEISAKCFQTGAELAVTSPSIQLVCARNWAKLSLHLDCSPLAAYQRAFALLPQLVSLGQTIQDRYDSLLSITDLAAEAAAWAVSVKLYDSALEWLEQGRSVVWSQTLQLRTPFDQLAKVNSDLADRLRDTASQLDVASSRSQFVNISIKPWQDLESQSQQHRRLAKQWGELLAEARQLPGFDGFMLPRTSADLKRAATDGPIVVINTHNTRCDALVIFPECDDVAHIPLDSLENQMLVQICSQVISLVGRQEGSARSVMYFPPLVESQGHLQPLADLWLSVVGPVLNTLACTPKLPHDELPHVTWCATGVLSFVPLHAAGLHDGHSPNAFDLAVSSYTPTLSALLPRCDQTVEQTHGVLAVGQANARGQPPLPMTVQELAIVKKHTKTTSYCQLDGASATVEATLDAMEQHSWVHLACHAVQNRDNPSHSAFYLHDGCLTLEEIAKRAFTNKGLAFLSACQTATGDHRLPDEATHLAAGMLTAGYPSVIATMWSIMGDDAPQIAEEVYAELMKEGRMDYRRTAMALHNAVGKLREKVGVESIGRWAPFIHVGV